MMIVFLQLLIIRVVLCDETSSFLTNVLSKIQRERLGQLDGDLGMNNNDNINENYDYIDVNYPDDVSDVAFKNYYQTDKMKYNDAAMKETNHDDMTAGQAKMNSVHHKGETSLPANDLIYIYNDTIYLYKTPNASLPPKQATALMDMIPFSQGKPHQGIFPHKLKIAHPTSHAQDQLNIIEGNEADNLINNFITGEEYIHATTPPTTQAEDGENVEGYYYYYYPLDQIPPELADSVNSMLSNSAKPVKPGMVTTLVKKPAMPGMPMKMVMKKPPKQPVGPLFKAMAVFVGTAVVFIVSILLLPRVKLVKAKSLSFNFDEFNQGSALQYHKFQK